MGADPRLGADPRPLEPPEPAPKTGGGSASWAEVGPACILSVLRPASTPNPIARARIRKYCGHRPGTEEPREILTCGGGFSRQIDRQTLEETFWQVT